MAAVVLPRPDPLPVHWRDLVRTQRGVLSRQQALAGGLTRTAWQHAVRSGRWRTVLPGVAVTHSGEPTEPELAWAAVLYAGDSAALDGDDALRQQGMRLPRRDEPLHVSVHSRRNVRDQRGAASARSGPSYALGVVVHRVSGLHLLVHPSREPPVVRPAPALLHAAAWATSDRAAEWRVAAAVQQRLVTVRQLRDALALLPRVKRRALVRTVLDDVELGAHARSELDLLAFLRAHGLPLPDRMNRPVRAATGLRYLDAEWDAQKVHLEMDGAHHQLVGQWEADLLRGLELAAGRRESGVTQVRLSSANLRHDEAAVAAHLRRLLL